MHDCPMTAEDVMLRMEPVAKEIGLRYPRKAEIDREDLIAEAYLAMCDAAHRYVEELLEISMDMERWIKRRIRDHLSAYVRDHLFWFLDGVPIRLKKRAIRVHTATERIKARGILRPTYEQIAGEARLPIEAVVSLSIYKLVIVRQSLPEWCEAKPPRATDEPPLIPSFGSQPGFTAATTCDDIHPGGKIRKGSLLCCMACHRSGVDGHPALRRSKASDPAPEPVREAPPTPPMRMKVETRVQIRARLYGPQVESVIA